MSDGAVPAERRVNRFCKRASSSVPMIVHELASLRRLTAMLVQSFHGSTQLGHDRCEGICGVRPDNNVGEAHLLTPTVKLIHCLGSVIGKIGQ